MLQENRRALGFVGAALLLMLSTTFAGTASAANVDLFFDLKPGESPACRVWEEGKSVQWNFTLYMNGTDTSLITTPTYVFVDDTGAPAMRGNAWIAILTASGDVAANPPPFDAQASNTFATGSGVYAPGPGSLDIYLYSTAHTPPAPVTNVSLLLTPSIESENKTHFFNVTVSSHRTGVPTILRREPVCVVIPPNPRFEMGNKTDSIQAAANSTVTVDFWLKNTGNTQDYYFCGVTVPREDWSWRFVTYMNSGSGQNYTNLTNIGQNITVRVSVYVPPQARARENSSVSLNCTSFKAGLLGKNLVVYPPYTKIEVIQFYYVCGQITGDSTLEGVPGDQLRFDYVVRNLGNGPDSGAAVIVAGNLSWDALNSPADFTLPAYGDPGWEQPAQFLVTIPERMLVGTYAFTVNVSSVVAGTPVCPLRFHITVKQMFAPDISHPAPVIAPPPPAQEVIFNFTIKNRGNSYDTLTISVINLTDWRVFRQPQLDEKALQVDEEYGITATVFMPRDPTKATVGNYTQVVRVCSKFAEADIGQIICVEANLSVIILPRLADSLSPPETTKEINPYASVGSVASVSFLLAAQNTGNGGDSLSMTYSASPDFTVDLRPDHLQLNLQETKAFLVTIEMSRLIAPGSHDVRITARSDASPTANCTAVYHLTIIHMDASINQGIRSSIQDPEDPGAPYEAVTLPAVNQVEGFSLQFRVFVKNDGDRAIAGGKLQVHVFDTLLCPGDPIGATVITCDTRPIFNWTNENPIITGDQGSAFFEFGYIAPEYLCFDLDICNRDVPPENAHRLHFVVTLEDESDTSNNEANLTVNVLPKRIIQHAPPPAPLPVALIGAGVGGAGAVGFVFWYRFIRKPKVDEDLYASIYGGGQAGPPEASPSMGQYLDSQKDQPGGQLPPQYQGMTDEQLEEARRLYGDSFGR